MTTTQTLQAGRIRKAPVRRTRIQDDMVADYLGMIVNPGDRTVQIGASELGAVCLRRGARHDIVAPVQAIDALTADCERRGVATDKLRGSLVARSQDGERAIDVAIFGPDTGFPAMAANWRHVAGRLKEGGFLVLLGADHGATARLADALEEDEAFELQDCIGGDAAIFRKRSAFADERAVQRLASVGNPARSPRGIHGKGIGGVFNRLFGRRVSTLHRGGTA